MSTGSQFRGDQRFYITLCSVRYTRSLRDAPHSISRSFALRLVCAFLFVCANVCALLARLFSPLSSQIPPTFLTFKENNDSTPLPLLCFFVVAFWWGLCSRLLHHSYFVVAVVLMMRFCICVCANVGPLTQMQDTTAAEAIGKKKWQSAFWFSSLSWLSTVEVVTLSLLW